MEDSDANVVCWHLQSKFKFLTAKYYRSMVTVYYKDTEWTQQKDQDENQVTWKGFLHSSMGNSKIVDHYKRLD